MSESRQNTRLLLFDPIGRRKSIIMKVIIWYFYQIIARGFAEMQAGFGFLTCPTTGVVIEPGTTTKLFFNPPNFFLILPDSVLPI